MRFVLFKIYKALEYFFFNKVYIKYLVFLLNARGLGLRIYGFGIQIVRSENVKLGSNVALNGQVYINASYPIIIGNDVAISQGAKLITLTLDYMEKPMRKKHIGGPIEIGCNVQVGAGAIILPNVKIGSNVVVAAGSVVTKCVENDVIVGGVPAKVIKKIL